MFSGLSRLVRLSLLSNGFTKIEVRGGGGGGTLTLYSRREIKSLGEITVYRLKFSTFKMMLMKLGSKNNLAQHSSNITPPYCTAYFFQIETK